jgi:two-component system cell cycle response regulator DivK
MPPRILYIEDNLDNLILVRRILRAAGFELLEATNAEDGITLAVQQQPDLILMDINMPKMDGLAATAHMRQLPELKDIPIVALTADVMRGVVEKTQAAGCDGYIAKPIDVDRFPKQIHALLEAKRTPSMGD